MCSSVAGRYSGCPFFMTVRWLRHLLLCTCITAPPLCAPPVCCAGTQTGTAERFAKSLRAQLESKYGGSTAFEALDIEQYGGWP